MDKKPSITGCEIGKKVTEAFRKGVEHHGKRTPQ